MVTLAAGESVFCNAAWEAIVGRGITGALRSFDQTGGRRNLGFGGAVPADAGRRRRRTRHREEFSLPAGMAVARSGTSFPFVRCWRPTAARDQRPAHALGRRRHQAERARQSAASVQSRGPGRGLRGSAGRAAGFHRRWRGRPGQRDAGRLARSAGRCRAARSKLGDMMSEDAGHLLRVLARQTAEHRQGRHRVRA